VLVDAEAYLLELTRYLHLNPVRAGMVTEPEEYRWSGHRAYLGLETIPWLTTEWVLGQFSGSLSAARRAYRRFVMEGKGESRQEEYYKGSDADSRISGNDTFIDRVLDQKPGMGVRSRVSLNGVIRAVCKHYKVQEVELDLSGRDRRTSEARGVVAWLILETGVCTLTELGKVTVRDVTTLSSAVRRLQIRMKKDMQFAAMMKGLLKAVS